jgi:hypothetical protein
MEAMELDLNDPEIKKAFDEAVAKAAEEAAAAKIEEATKNLSGNNKKLLDELKTAQKKLKQYDGLSAEEIEELKAAQTKLQEVAEAEALKKGEYDKLTAKLKETHTAELAKFTKALEDERTQSTNYLKQTELLKALNEAKVEGPYQKAAIAMLWDQFSVETADDGQRLLKAGDKDLKEFIAAWATSDEGKFFVSAPNNNGGGAQGSGTPRLGQAHLDDIIDTKTGEVKNWDKLSQLAKDQPQQYEQINKQFKLDTRIV